MIVTNRRDHRVIDGVARTAELLEVSDPATGQRLALESFGPSNAAVFARWLQSN